MISGVHRYDKNKFFSVHQRLFRHYPSLVKTVMLPQISLRSTFPFWLTLCLLLSLGSVGILGTTPAFAQGRKQAAEKQLSQREDADFQLRLGQQAEQQGQLDKAIFHWQKAANIYQRFGDEEGLGLTYDYLGEAYVNLGDFRAAENAFRRRLAVARDRDDLQAQMFALNNLGTIFLKQGNINLAEEVFTDALAIARSVENALTAGVSLHNLGLAATLREDYDEAVKRYRTAILFRQEAKDPQGEAITFANLADALRLGGQPQESVIAYTDAYLTATDIRDFATQFRAYEGKFLAYKTMNQTSLAFRELNRWATLAQARDNLQEEFKTVEHAAYLYAELGDEAQAETFLLKAIEMAEQVGALDNIAFLRQKLSEIQFGKL